MLFKFIQQVVHQPLSKRSLSRKRTVLKRREVSYRGFVGPLEGLNEFFSGLTKK